ncbi:MAG: glycerate kinase [Solirubrobacterales bacterium]|nr:glycerate kinase [Solirubrobacterales bacterium]
MNVPGVPSTILVAPDSFKGTLTAEEVATAIARGLQSMGRPVDLCPVADGGEGTLSALSSALEGELLPAVVSDPLGRSIDAELLLVRPNRGRPFAVVESAQASGLSLVAEGDRDALGASTYGTGELIVAAIDAGATAVYLGVGGSATTDGGSGALRAIEEAGGLRGTTLTVLCDVRTPFEQAGRVFGEQKGADPGEVRRLTARLHGLARGFRHDPRGTPMTGAAGGLAGGLWSELGAELVPGATFVLERIGFDQRLRDARAVVAGEGRLDRQSLSGKVLSEVATRARQTGVPSHAVVGQNALSRFEQRILDLQAVLEAGTTPELERAGSRLAELI